MLDTLYDNSLIVGGSTLIIFAYVLVFGKVPKTESYASYNRTRKIIGTCLFLWGIQILIQYLFHFRTNQPHIATALNVTCYDLGAILFGMGYISLLRPSYICKRQITNDFTKWMIISCTAWISALSLQGTPQLVGLIIAASGLLAETIRVSVTFIYTYRRTVYDIENYYSDNIEFFIQWLYRSTWGTIFFGVIGAIMAFAPRWAIALYMTGGIFMFTYIFMSLLNYSLNCQKVEEAILQKVDDKNNNLSETKERFLNALNKWIDEKGYLEADITIEQLAKNCFTNRSYISSYFNKVCNVSFRDWINDLRIKEAKKLLLDNKDFTIDKIAQQVGFKNGNYFSTLFKQHEDMTPTNWRKKNQS